MKSEDTPRRFPQTSEEWETVIAEAPDRVPYDPKEDAYDPNDPEAVEAFWKDAVMVNGGGIAAVRAALAERRKQRGARGPQVAPTKARVTLRLSKDVLQYFKAKGAGWQTRIDEALKKFILTLK